MPEQNPSQDIKVTVQGDAQLKGIAIGNDNQIITEVTANTIVQAQNSTVTIVGGHQIDIQVYSLAVGEQEGKVDWAAYRKELRKESAQPYKFLQYYETTDADRFFGRDAICDHIISKLMPYKAVLINGKSGSGKTSLVNAGLIPRLMNRGYLNFVFRDYGYPTDLIKQALRGVPGLDLPVDDCPDLTHLLSRVVEQLQRPLAIFLDQFERFFLNLPDAERVRFIKEIKTCFSAFSGEQIDFVFAMREDFYGRIGEFWKVFPEFDADSFKIYLEPFNPTEAKEVILKPLKGLPVGYAPQFVDNVLVPGLMGQTTGGKQIEPPHLQIVCNRLYDAARAQVSEGEIASIDAALYGRLGGAQSILQTYLDDVVTQAAGGDPARVAMIRSMLKLMIQTSGTRKFVSLPELTAGVPDVPPTEIELLTRKLQDDRVIEPRGQEQQVSYSLSHEFMAAKVQSWYDEREMERKKAQETMERGLAEWKSLQTLLNDKQVKLIRSKLGGEGLNAETEELLTRSQQAYEERQRKEAEQERRIRLGKRLLWGVIAVAFIVAGALALWALRNANEANQQAEQAKRQEALALQNEEHARQAANISRSRELAAHARTALDSDPTLSFRLSEAALEIAPTQQAESIFLASLQHPFYTTLQWDQAANGAAFSPDGTQILIRAKNAFQLRDLARDQEICHWIGDVASIRDVAFSPQGTFVIASYADPARERPVQFYETATGDVVDLLARLQETPGYVVSARMSPDEGQLITVSHEQIVTMWNLTTGQKQYVLNTPGNKIAHVAFSPDGASIITAGYDGMTVFDATTGTPRPELMGATLGNLESIPFSRDGKRVISEMGEGLTIWNIADGQPISTLPVYTGAFSLSAEFSPDGAQVVTTTVMAGVAGRMESAGQIWEVASGAELFALNGHAGPINMAAYAPDGKRIVTASDDKTARVWDAISVEALLPLDEHLNRELYVLKGHSAAVSSAVFAPDGRTLATVSGGTVRIWDIGMHLERLVLQGHAGIVRDAQFSPDSTTILTASDDQTAMLWDAATGQLIHTLAHPHAVTHATFAPDGTTLVTAGKNQPVRVWNRATGEHLYRLEPGGNAVFSPDGTLILTGTSLWEASTGKLLRTLQGQTGEILSTVFAPNGDQILIASDDGTVRIWEMTGKLRQTLQGHRFPVYKAVYSPDGALVATVSYDATTRLWEVGKHTDQDVIRNAKVVEQQGYPVTHAVFSPDGRWLVTVATSLEIFGEPTMRIWDVPQLKRVHELQERTCHLHDGAFSPDSQRFVSGSCNGNAARVWDVATGQQLYALLAHTDAVTSAVFAPDGQSILTAARDGTARIWPVTWEEMLMLLNQQHVRGRIRHFTPEEKQRYGFGN